MKTTVKTASISRTTAVEAEIEIEATDGGPGYELIGQPEAQGAATLKAALRAADLDRTLHTNTRITIRPEHPGNEDLHELPITLGLLQLHGKIPADALGDSIVAGAVDRNGELRASRGMYAVARLAGPRHLITAEENEPELIDAGVTDATLAGDIDHMVERLRGEQPPNNASDSSRRHAEDRGFAAIAGWEADKSALEIAVAGRHALLVSGARTCPAIGLMRRAATLWPSPEGAEIEALRRMYSLAGLRLEECTGTNRRPVRAPHFSCSTEAIVGRNSRRSQEGLFGRSLPGEASLAHGGILHHRRGGVEGRAAEGDRRMRRPGPRDPGRSARRARALPRDGAPESRRRREPGHDETGRPG